MQRTKSKLLTGLTLTTGAEDWRPKGQRQCATRVISLIHPDNLPSRRVAEKNGMTVDKKIIFRGFPTLVYAINRERWLKNRAA